VDSLLKKLIAKTAISKKDIEEALCNICDRVHATCDDECPVYALNGSKVPECSDKVHYGGCLTFKDGKAMLKFINTHRLAPNGSDKNKAWKNI
jgi:hypothetical protein